MNKKGITMITSVVIGIILASAILMLVLFPVWNAVASLLPNRWFVDKQTMSSFNKLVNAVENGKEGKNTLGIFIKEDYAIIGFNVNKEIIEDKKKILRPGACGIDKSCLCLCEEEDCVKNLIDCKISDKNIRFLDENGKDLVISGGSLFKKKEIKIAETEKVRVDDGFNFYVRFQK